MNLDFSLFSDRERAAYIRENLKEQPYLRAMESLSFGGSSLGRSLERAANYILFGKDSKLLTNGVQRKQLLRPSSKHQTYASKKVESLDALLDNPLTDQLHLRPFGEKNIYLKKKRQIGRPSSWPCPPNTCSQCSQKESCLGALGGGEMAAIWHSIDLLEALRDLSDPDEAYLLRHWAIQLRQKQYVVLDSQRPMIPSSFGFAKKSPIDWETNSGHWDKLPPDADLDWDNSVEREPDEIGGDSTYHYYQFLGEEKFLVRARPRDLWHPTWQIEKFVPFRNHLLNLADPFHVYCLLELWDQLYKESWEDLNGQMKFILIDLQDAAFATTLNPIHEKILELKVLKWTNERIRHEVARTFGQHTAYNVNYISTIFKKTICGAIAASAQRLKKEWKWRNDPSHWKVCHSCGQKKLLDSCNFVKKAGNPDGFSGRCKACDKAMRERRKHNNGRKGV